MKKFTLVVFIFLIVANGCKKDQSTMPKPNSNLSFSGSANSINPFAYQVSTLAGGQNRGLVDGIGITSKFNSPQGIAAYDGYLYVADFANEAIRKIKISDRTVVTIAGNGTIGSSNGSLQNATFYGPDDIAMGPDGYLYITDSGNFRIRKVSRVGLTTTYAGSVKGYQDGPISSALFGMVSAIAIGKDGAKYVYDASINRIRKISKAGMVSTYAGDSGQSLRNGPALSAEFNYITGMSVAADGTLYVADAGNNCIRKVSTDGQVTTVTGGYALGYKDGPALTAEFDYPTDVQVTVNGTLFIVDSGNCRIRMMTPQGVVSTLAGAYNYQNATPPADGPGATAIFRIPLNVAYFEKALYITEYADVGPFQNSTNADIRKVALPVNY
jgi:hypothetical protein